MELSILLIQQICQLFIMIFFGFLLVRGRVLTAENSKVLSILLLYVACPCAIINSFMIDFTSDKLIGLGISFLYYQVSEEMSNEGFRWEMRIFDIFRMEVTPGGEKGLTFPLPAVIISEPL